MAETIELQTITRQNGEPSPRISTPTPTTYPSGVKFALITLGLIFSVFLCAVDTTILATAIPAITDAFGSITNIAWYGSAYSVTNTAFQSSWGRAYDYFNLKYVFLLAMAVFEIGNVICATAPNSQTLILGRVVAGIGGGGIMTGAFIIIALTARPEYRATYFATVGITFGVASVAGPLMGGALTDGLGWRWCFWISLPLGLVAAATMLFFFSPPIPPKPATLRERIIRMDLGGAVLATGCLSCFVLAMHWVGILPWKSASVIMSFIGFGLLAALFLINEWQMGSKAMIQAHLLKKPSIAVNLVFIFCLAGLYFPLLYSLPIQFQSVNNASASQSGMRLIPLVLGISIFTLAANGILTFWRHYKPFLIVGALAGTTGVSLIYTLDMHASTAMWIGYELLTAIGVGLALQIPMIANQAAVSAEDIAAVTSLSLFCENVGTSLFVAAGEAAFTNGVLNTLATKLPQMDAKHVLDAGATQLRKLFDGKVLDDVLGAYLNGCQLSYVVSVACGVAACVVSFASAGTAGMREVKARFRKQHEP